MKLLPYLILAYITLGIQSGLGVLWNSSGVMPNLVLLVVIFIASHASRDAALLGCFCLGLMQDLLSQQPLGVYALAYGFVGLIIVGAGHNFARTNPLIQMGTALVCGIVVLFILLINQRFVPAAPALQLSPDSFVPAIRPPVWPLISGVFLTSLLAPLVLWPLHKMKRYFAFDRRRW
ncbi:MAG: rod shape-determining protein MreD [Phycisphaerales bacterium]|nr:rod shape-determining protein MreD [Phycisphaerales bacterium]